MLLRGHGVILELSGASVTNYAFAQGLGTSIGATIVTVGLLFFAFTTILGWCYYGERCFLYLVGIRGIKLYRFVFIVLVGAGSFLTLDLIWILADIVNGLMAFPNLDRINWFTQRDYFRNQGLL